ncbi:hypothetical protein KY289_009589 [Solanum tuberosum]|nr:hypothetical protein KY289_009589 [Solanum tuberosum]
MKEALNRQDPLKIPEGKFYLVDAGLMLKSGLITPYRGERYHLKENSRNPPRNSLIKMAKNLKPFTSTDTNISDNSLCIWSHTMDDALIDAFCHEQELVNRVGGSFTTHVLDIILRELRSKFPNKILNKERIQNRMRNIKKQFSKYYDTFQMGMIGFAWEPITNMWNAEPEVWDQLIQAKHEAADLRTKSIRNYDKLMMLYGKDRASGKHAETGPDILKRDTNKNLKRSSTSLLTIEEVDEMISMNGASLENTEGDKQDEQSQPINDARMADMLRGGMDNLAHAINQL